MNDIVTPIIKRTDMPLEECIAAMEQFGDPRISKIDGSWNCGVTVFVVGEGTEFKVRSEWNHVSVTEAANLCYQRLMTELERIKET